jgi:hypothetical protein
MSNRKRIILVGGCLLLAGSGLLSWRSWQRHLLSQALPAGVSLDSPATSGPLVQESLPRQMLGMIGIGAACGRPRLPTVEEELSRLGAVCRDGSFWTPEGQEIVFAIDDPRVDYEPHHFEGKTVIVVLPTEGECTFKP